MVVTRCFVSRSGSGLGQVDQEAPTKPKITGQEEPVMTEDWVREIIREEVVEIVRGQILEMFGSIKTAMMEYFDDIYATLAEMAAASATTAGGGASRGFQ